MLIDPVAPLDTLARRLGERFCPWLQMLDLTLGGCRGRDRRAWRSEWQECKRHSRKPDAHAASPAVHEA